MAKKTLLLLLLFFPNIIFSQLIKGKIIDEFDIPIEYANVLIKEFNNPDEIIEYTNSTKGNYSIKLKKNYSKIRIDVDGFGYKKQFKYIENPKKDSIYKVNFILIKEAKVDSLNKVIIFAKKNPFKLKKDTVQYNVKSYADGTEKKIQDLLKKLPGIEVNENSGEIKYKGKSIETVLLEGDNLFGYNYSLGTKNINIDIVKQVEAIENYSENSLLKNIEGNDKVALNLKLKNGKTDFSGNLDIGTGVFENKKQARNFNANILGINRSYKSFATVAHNNIGMNHSSFDYFGYKVNIEQIKEKDYFAKKIIPETSFSNQLNNERVNINNQFFVNYNSIFKINKRLKVRINLYYLNDNITNQQLLKNLYTINENSFTTIDDYSTKKLPIQYRGDLKIEYNTSKKSLLEYDARIRQENINTTFNISSNNDRTFISNLSSNDFFLKQKLLFTKKISKNKAFQVSLLQSTNNIPQTYKISPSLFNSGMISEDTQNSKNKKNYIKADATLLGAKKNNRYTFIVGSIYEDNFLTSQLTNNNLIENNQLKYNKTRFYQLGNYNFNYKRWSFAPAYSVSYMTQKIKDNRKQTDTDQTNLMFEPSLKIKYKLNKTSFFLGKINYNQFTNAENYLFRRQVLINNRITITNTPNLELQKTLNYSLLYYKNDLYNQFQINLGANYRNTKGNYFTNSTISENTIQINYFYLPQHNDNLSFNALVEKYIPFIESTIKLTSDYSISKFKNIINNSELRNNKNQFLNTKLHIKTAFDGFLNFKNTFNLSKTISQNQNNKVFKNSSYQNQFDIIAVPSKKWLFVLASSYLVPDAKQKRENYLFTDFSIRYRPSNKKLEFNFRVNNIFNENNIERVQISDFSTTINRTNILPRYYLVNMTYNF